MCDGFVLDAHSYAHARRHFAHFLPDQRTLENLPAAPHSATVAAIYGPATPTVARRQRSPGGVTSLCAAFSAFWWGSAVSGYSAVRRSSQRAVSFAAWAS